MLFEIDNPELITKWRQAQAGVDVAKAQLANILVGTRAEIVDQKKAALESAQANFTLADKTYARIKDLAGIRQRAAATARRGHELARSGEAGSGQRQARL